MKDSEKNLAESIRHRLRDRFKKSGEDISFGLQRYASERFLYRLGESSHRDRFILKGAALMPRFFTDDARAAQWRAYLSRNSLPGAPADFIAVGELLQAFLVPLWRPPGDSRKFSDFWPPLGPWTASNTSEDSNL